jgi:pyroglutamyl-peptidase
MTAVLITGFGPFPGAPSNPTMAIARHLGTMRRQYLADVRRVVRLLPTTWAMLDSVAGMVSATAPDAVLMFGLAGRRRRITPETRALNRAGILRRDAAGCEPFNRRLTPGGPRARAGTIDAHRMVARLKAAGLPSTASRDAGDYLCNALFWRMLEQGRPCIFVHMPRPVRATRPKGRLKRPRPTLKALKLAGELALREVLLGLRWQTSRPQVATPRHKRS